MELTQCGAMCPECEDGLCELAFGHEARGLGHRCGLCSYREDDSEDIGSAVEVQAALRGLGMQGSGKGLGHRGGPPQEFLDELRRLGAGRGKGSGGKGEDDEELLRQTADVVWAIATSGKGKGILDIQEHWRAFISGYIASMQQADGTGKGTGKHAGKDAGQGVSD